MKKKKPKLRQNKMSKNLVIHENTKDNPDFKNDFT